MVLHVAKGTATLKDYLKKPEETEASTLKSQPSKPQEGMHQSETVFMSKFTLTQEQHKAEMLWALKSVMSISPTTQARILGMCSEPCFQTAKLPSSGLVVQASFHTSSHLELHPTSRIYCLLSWQKHLALFCHLMSPSIQSCSKSKWTLWWGTLHKVWWRQGTWLLPFLDIQEQKTWRQSLKMQWVTWMWRNLLKFRWMGPMSTGNFWICLNRIWSSQDQYPDFLNTGSCSLHVVHGAFHSGMLKTSWGIDSVLKALHNLFSESPAKIEDFIKLTGTETFPLPFCGHRWLENKKVAERALEIWPHITTYIRETLKKPKS